MDFFISLDCFPVKRVHNGCRKAAEWLYAEIEYKLDYLSTVEIEGHSMGGGIAQALAVILQRKGYDVSIEIMGAFPATRDKRIRGTAYIYGNDPVPRLFCWFKYPCKTEYVGSARKWWKINFRDHMRYW